MSATAVNQPQNQSPLDQKNLQGMIKSPWIISPLADLLFFVATPILIVPVVLLLQNYFTAQQIFLVVLSFCSVGHHLPGFIRAYTDPLLFKRFFWRLLLLPPLLFATCLLFESYQLIGLKVIIVLWATWHGLMQTYGFMRIYDAKRGIVDRLTARLDFWLCIAMFVCGTIFSDARTFDFLRRLWESGFPLFGLEWLIALRWIVGISAGAVGVIYVLHLIKQYRNSQPVHWNKLLLATSTAGIWWICGMSGIDALIGVAMFEIYHAIQYLAIVWVTNHKQYTTTNETSSSTVKLLKSPAMILVFYLGLIATYGAVHHFAALNLPDTLAQWAARGSTEGMGVSNASAASWISLFSVLPLAILGTSTLLHYYFDGFIWKVREKHTQQSLNLNSGETSPSRIVPGLVHALKWACFFIPVGMLLGLEFYQRMHPPVDQQQRQLEVAKTLASYAPQSVDAQLFFAKVALTQHSYASAIEACEQALHVNPNQPIAHAILGNVWQEKHQPKKAILAYTSALKEDPSNLQVALNLAGVYQSQQAWKQAERIYLDQQAYHPNDEKLQYEVATLYGKWGVRLQQQQLPQAENSNAIIEKFQQALAGRPDWSEVRLQLAMCYLNNAEVDLAEQEFQTVLKNDSQSNLQRVEANFYLGTIAQAKQEHQKAIQYYQQVLAKNPKFAQAHLNLGAAFAATGEFESAETSYIKAIQFGPTLSQAHYNLSILLWNQISPKLALGLNAEDIKSLKRARQHLIFAKQLGATIPIELWQEVGQAIASQQQ